MEWVTGVKLTGLPPAEIQRLVAAGQEAFLTQLLEVGFFHGDPHPGNLLKVGALHCPHPSLIPPLSSGLKLKTLAPDLFPVSWVLPRRKRQSHGLT